MKVTQAEIIIVGSGPGGAILAKGLCEYGKNVLILEKGGEQYKKSTLAKRLYTAYHEKMLLNKMIRKLKKLLLIDKNLISQSVITVGGTSTVASANAVRSLENELYSLGVDVKKEFQEIEQELNVTLFPQNLMGKGAKGIWEAADSLGYRFEAIPKCIDFSKCTGCGKCNIGCPEDAKWTAIDMTRKAQGNGAVLLHNVTVKEILVSNGSVEGVKAMSAEGEIFIRANIVVLAAGALESPVILQKTGIESAGKKLFCDPCFCVYGPHKNASFSREPRSIMDTEFLNKDGFILLNCIIHSRKKNYLPRTLRPRTEMGMMGIMIKIKDDPIGSVHRNGGIRKTMTSNDLRKLNVSIPIAKEILCKAGVDHRHIRIKSIGGFHPGGTAAIGEVVNSNLETEIKNLFVSDASVLPDSPGLPPMLTIMALSKRLKKRIIAMI